MINRRLIILVVVTLTFTGALQAQAPPSQPPSPSTPGKPIAPRATQRSVVVETSASAPQVVTLLHRLSGLKMFRLLLRSGDVTAIAQLDDNFTFRGQVHTNIIAGLALDDGETIAAWLPEVDAEIGPPPPPLPSAVPNAPVPAEAPAARASAVPEAKGPQVYTRRFATLFERPDLTVLGRDHKRLSAQYVGLDGITGLSVLKLANKEARVTDYAGAEDKNLSVGQRVHLFTPEPIDGAAGARRGPVYVRLGKIEAVITKLLRAPSGGIARLEIRAPKISAKNIGGVALTEAGKTLGIIDAVNGNEATILPTSLIKGAAKRVLARQASVPRPWLGVRGMPLETYSFEQLLRSGWESQTAKALAADRLGILLTSVVPNSPAYTAALRPGDVILRVNDGEVRSIEDFSWVLEEAGPGGLLRFTVARPGKESTDAVEVKLSEAPDPFFGLRTPQALPGLANGVGIPDLTAPRASNYSLLTRGVETIAIRPGVASRLGSKGGLLVVSVAPATAAFSAGLRAGDVIETINGKALAATADAAKLLSEARSSYSFTVVRNKQRLSFTVITDDE